MPEFLSPLAYLYVIPVLGFMILIHEFGHFAVAKLLGVHSDCVGLKAKTPEGLNLENAAIAHRLVTPQS